MPRVTLPPMPADDAATQSAKNLMVCRLSRSVDDRALWNAFAVFGTVESSLVMRDIHTGVSQCKAFVRFARHEDAEAARVAMHHSTTLGTRINVRWAHSQHDAAPAGAARSEMHELFMRNVPLDVCEEQLRMVVAPYGTATRVRLCEDTQPNATAARRIAFVEFAEDGAAEAALYALHNRLLFPSCGRVPLLCKLKEDYGRGKQHSTTTASSPDASLPITPRVCRTDDGIAVSVSLLTDSPLSTTRRSSEVWDSVVLAGCPALRVCGTMYRHDPYNWSPLSMYDVTCREAQL